MSRYPEESRHPEVKQKTKLLIIALSLGCLWYMRSKFLISNWAALDLILTPGFALIRNQQYACVLFGAFNSVLAFEDLIPV